uniref:Polyprotein 2 n=1 Tax=Scotland dicistro-like virus TaxID=2789512 RepID=A0A7T1GW24_9VIRU|nr:polyprotein 2 [Scotland dicistro-like virus]
METKKTEQDTVMPAKPGTSDERSTVTGTQDISLIGEARAEEHHDIVNFSSDGKTIDSESVGPCEIDQLLSSLRSNESIHTITTFLSRPIKLDNFKCTSVYKIVYHVSPTVALYEHKAMCMARAKLDGFYGMKCTFNLKIVANPQPFQHGVYVLYFVPGPDWATFMPWQERNNENGLPYATGCPHVIMNFATQSQVTLSVPYVGVTPFIDLTQLDKKEAYLSHPGTFYFRAICPIEDSTSNPFCEATAYLSFTNVELFGATDNTFSQIFCPQIGSYGQQQLARDKEISSPVGELIKTVGPLMAAGLSRPISDARPSRTQITPVGSTALYNTVDSSFKMSLDARQNVKISQMGVSENDEMNINNYVSLPGYVETVKWNVSDPAGKLLNVQSVNPNAKLFWHNSGHASGRELDYVYPNRLRYAASLFKYWRGSIRYTFHIAATKFHSGRLRIQYTVGPWTKEKHPSPRKYTHIIDIRDGQQFTIEVPYIHPKPWQRVPQIMKTIDDVQQLYAVGVEYDHNTLEIYVENELLTNTNSSQEVKIAIFTSGGPDFQVAAPVIPAMVPEPSTGVGGFQLNYPTPKEEVFKPQGLIEDDREIIDITTGQRAQNRKEHLPSHITIGEVCTNFRQLLRRYSFLQKVHLTETETATMIRFHPFMFERVGSTGSKLDDRRRCNDPLMYLMGTYLFYRGGMRYLFSLPHNVTNAQVFFDPASTQTNVIQYDERIKNFHYLHMYRLQVKINDEFQDDAHMYFNRPATQPISTLTNQALFSFEIPFYSANDKAITGSTTGHDWDNYVRGQQLECIPNGHVTLQLDQDATNDKTTIALNVYRATADDFNFGYALGPPSCVVNVYTAHDITVSGSAV